MLYLFCMAMMVVVRGTSRMEVAACVYPYGLTDRRVAVFLWIHLNISFFFVLAVELNYIANVVFGIIVEGIKDLVCDGV
jgi:hypothetical protein